MAGAGADRRTQVAASFAPPGSEARLDALADLQPVEPGIAGHKWFITSGWQKRTGQLFELAGQVARKLDKPLMRSRSNDGTTSRQGPATTAAGEKRQ